MRIAIIDDHKLFRRGLINLISLVNTELEIVFEADDGNDLRDKIKGLAQPDIIQMDVNMLGIDGFASVE